MSAWASPQQITTIHVVRAWCLTSRAPATCGPCEAACHPCDIASVVLSSVQLSLTVAPCCCSLDWPWSAIRHCTQWTWPCTCSATLTTTLDVGSSSMVSRAALPTVVVSLGSMRITNWECFWAASKAKAKSHVMAWDKTLLDWHAMNLSQKWIKI